MLNDVSMWKSKTTVFEIGGGANPDYKMMRKRRHKYDGDNGDESSEVNIEKCNKQDHVINEDGNDTFLKVNKDVLNELENEWNANEELDVNNKQSALICGKDKGHLWFFFYVIFCFFFQLFF
eukprot:510399_1